MQQQSASIQLASSGKSPDPKSGSVYKNHNNGSTLKTNSVGPKNPYLQSTNQSSFSNRTGVPTSGSNKRMPVKDNYVTGPHPNQNANVTALAIEKL